MSDHPISKRQSSAIIQAFGNGVTPRIGLEHVVVGRGAEITAMLDDLDHHVAPGNASFRLVVGPYGSGKSFTLQVIRNYALQRNFVVADADLSAERRLTGTKGQGLGLYRELLKNMAIRTRPEGSAFAPLLEHWITSIQEQVLQTTNLPPDDQRFTSLVQEQMQTTLRSISALPNRFDFMLVITLLWRGYQQGDDLLMERALRWLRGEYQTKKEAKADLSVNSLITDANWYGYLKLFASFFKTIGYQGLIIFFDEAVNLYKISNSVSRNANYEQILTMFNDTNQGVAEHIGLIFSGTPQLVEDQRRGLFSYEALRSRLQESRFAQAGRRDFSGPIIRLDPLTNEELFVLLQKLRDIHARHYAYSSTISDRDLTRFMEVVMNKLGSAQLLTPRELSRDFIAVMEMLRNDPAATFLGIIEGDAWVVSHQGANPEELTSETEIKDEENPFAGFTL